ncbi:HIT domain-containing protein [Aliiglaciecola sp. 3_MG-2023]|uniref:HIT domain-containing protein n=1 Tax=Aliiglaciecola sp. 3_MG-2023 TaxID=3062644 RepID=UPI0026E24355|nr:HIT domain-containing protein [Aliiglaciecola sp. 3_MG-2023]MDO6695545.1 HIT domain-containing protein [Aliiglaciecola sp. 3_MG-2023]
MHNADFQLDPQLAKDCFEVCDLPLSKILLLNDLQYPWFIQVPRVNNVSEIIDLNEAQQSQLWYESKILSESIKHVFQPFKLNIAALGNMVSQLHIHHIARFQNDVAWPKPVWGVATPKHYESADSTTLMDKMATLLGEKIC